MKYKVGDKVRIRKDLKADWYGGCSATPFMAEHAGEFVTVKSYVGHCPNRFLIKERLAGCSTGWHWSEEMMEGLADEPATEQPHTDWSWEDLF